LIELQSGDCFKQNWFRIRVINRMFWLSVNNEKSKTKSPKPAKLQNYINQKTAYLQLKTTIS
jgi:hypothetical protein